MKNSRYIKYAIGEIVLVVIGILIALQINTWNEDFKRSRKKMVYVKSLLNDLNNDVLEILKYNEDMLDDLELLEHQRARLRQEYATIDTVMQIARHEFIPYYNPGLGLNTNTYVSLRSTGSLDILDDWLIKALLNLHTIQIRTTAIIEYNLNYHLQIQTDYDNHFPVKPMPDDTAALNDKLLDQLWDGFSDHELSTRFMGVFESKYVMQKIVVRQRDSLILATKELIEKIKQNYPNLVS